MPPELGFGLTIDNEPDNRGISPAQPARPALAADPTPDPTLSTAQRDHASPTFDSVVAAMRKAIGEGRFTKDQCRR